MRNALTFLFCVCASFFLSAQPNLQDSARAIITFDHTSFDCGKVLAETTVIHEFKFTNTGTAPLIITDVPSAGAGFTPDAFPKEPIAPGNSGVIKITYNTTGKSGGIWKQIGVHSNGSERAIFLSLSGTIYDPNGPIMKFDSTTYWFDTIYQGSIIVHEFRFTNTGKSPLVISNVCGSSGCIVPEYTKEPIAPGKSGVVGVRFHSGGKMGPQDKCLTVTSNASEPTIVLHIKGIVVLPPPIQYSPQPPANNSGK